MVEATGIAALGLDWKALLFQVVNFAILLFLLKRFAYKPVVAILEARRQRIEESLENAGLIEQAKAQLAATQQRVLREAATQAQIIIDKAKQQGQQVVKEAEGEAQQKAHSIVIAATAQLEADMAEAQAKLKMQATDLVIAATEKILQEKLTAERDQTFIKDALETL